MDVQGALVAVPCSAPRRPGRGDYRLNKADQVAGLVLEVRPAAAVVEAMVRGSAAILGGGLAARVARAIDVWRPNRAEGYLRSGKLTRTPRP